MKLSATPKLLQEIIYIAQAASNAILNIYLKDHQQQTKADGSPLTLADMVSHHLIMGKLNCLSPNTLIISEESPDLDKLNQHLPEQFWLVDPLDGTKEFINRNGEFTVNIALIENGKPILGVVTAPALQTLYAGLQNEGAFKKESNGEPTSLQVQLPTKEGLIVTGSRSHGNQTAMNEFLKFEKIANLLATGSSLKFCKIAEGSAHLYPRLGRTMEWDTAAGHAVLAAAGGDVITMDGRPLAYGKPHFANPFFIAKPKKLTLKQASFK